MNRKKALLVLALPALAALALFGWSIVQPVIWYITSNTFTTLVEDIMYTNVVITMFGLPIGLWIVTSLLSFATGCYFVFIKGRKATFKGTQYLGMALSSAPVIIIVLAMCFARYDGP